SPRSSPRRCRGAYAPPNRAPVVPTTWLGLVYHFWGARRCSKRTRGGCSDGDGLARVGRPERVQHSAPQEGTPLLRAVLARGRPRIEFLEHTQEARGVVLMREVPRVLEDLELARRHGRVNTRGVLDLDDAVA